MKILTITTFLMVWCTLYSNAQNIKSQTDELANIKSGMYTAYLTHKDGEKYIGGINDLHHEITEIKDYRLKPGVHKEIYLIQNKDPKRPKEMKPLMLVPDNPAFPVTYVSAVYEGNKKLQKEIGYCIRKSSGYGTQRAVFLDGKIYWIEDWKDKDNYTLKAVLEHTEKPLKGLKLVREVYKTPKKMKNSQPDATLRAYLENAFAKQEEVYVAWIKDSQNAAFVAKQEKIAQAMNDYIKNDREEYLKSDEYKRIMANNRRAERVAKQSNVTIQNKLGRDIYVFNEGSRNGTPVRANSSGTFDCTKSLYYSTSGKSELNGNGLRIYTANTSCGGIVVVD